MTPAPDSLERYATVNGSMTRHRLGRALAPGIVVLAIAFYELAYSTASILRHGGLNSSGLDLAMQDQVLWNTSQGRFFQTSFEVENFLGDHVSLFPVLLAPLVWLPGAGVKWLLIFQSVALGSSAWPLYRLTQMETKSRFCWMAFPIAFLLYPLLGFANRFDFHFVVFSIPCLTWMLLFLRQRRLLSASAAALLAVTCREEIGIAVAGLAVYAMFQPHRGARRWGIIVAPVALLWSVLALTWIIPHFRGGPSDTLMRYHWLGDTPPLIMVSLLTRPMEVIRHLLDDPVRTRTILFLLWPLALLPLFAPQRLVCALVPLSVCLLPDHPSMNSIFFQYLSPVVAVVWWAAIGGAARFERWVHRLLGTGISSWVAPTALILSSLTAIYTQNPFTKAVTRPFWDVRVSPARPNVLEFHEAAAMISPQDSVLTTMAFAPHLSRRRDLGLIGWPSAVRDPEVVVADVSDFRWYENPDEYVRKFGAFLEGQGFGIQYWSNGVVLLRRGQEHQYEPAAVVRELHANYRDFQARESNVPSGVLPREQPPA